VISDLVFFLHKGYRSLVIVIAIINAPTLRSQGTARLKLATQAAADGKGSVNDAQRSPGAGRCRSAAASGQSTFHSMSVVKAIETKLFRLETRPAQLNAPLSQTDGKITNDRAATSR
jgi:hypothetical protein